MVMEDLPLIDHPQPHDQRIETLIAAFREHFGHDPDGIAEAPGRVNLIGEHVDYNDGLVLPFAVDRSVLCAWVKPDLDQVHDTSAQSLYRQLGEDLSGMVEFWSADLRDMYAIRSMFHDAHLIDQSRHHDWSDYPAGIVWALRNADIPYGGLCVSYAGNVPQGAGLSSSAALEVSIAGAFRDAFTVPITDRDLALLCQRAENEYVGVQCGIMDQFASALSKRDNALLIDCRTFDYKHVPLRLAEHNLAIVIANSAVKRELVTSAYNDRRRECEQAVARLRDLLARPDLASLRDVRASDLDTLNIDPGDIPLRRARHVVTEIGRVAETVDALARDDFTRVGELMVASHLSLKTDYDVSSEQLDLLVGLATAQDYVLGARLTGAGFGGCTVNLVRADRIDDFARDVIAPYRARTNLPAVTYATSPCDGLTVSRL